MQIAKELIQDKQNILNSIIDRVLRGVLDKNYAYEAISLLEQQIKILRRL